MISDYCCGDINHTQEYKDYLKQRGYHVMTVKVSRPYIIPPLQERTKCPSMPRTTAQPWSVPASAT